jgi:flagellar protein FliS
MTHSDWDYRSTEILTAPPQKLHLLLLEGALRFVRRTELAWQEGRYADGYQHLERARAIVAELIAGIRRDIWPEVAGKVLALYQFVYLTLAEAGLLQNLAKLRDAARVLEIERDTWRQLCEQMNISSQETLGKGQMQARATDGADAAAPPPASASGFGGRDSLGGGPRDSSFSQDSADSGSAEPAAAGRNLRPSFPPEAAWASAANPWEQTADWARWTPAPRATPSQKVALGPHAAVGRSPGQDPSLSSEAGSGHFLAEA